MADIKLDPTRVPPELHSLIPYAEKWGIRDESAQDALIHEASLTDLEDLYSTFTQGLDSVVGFVIAHRATGEPRSEEASIFDALWRAWREASYILKDRLPLKEWLTMVGFPEEFPGSKLDPAKLPPELHPLIPHAEK